MNMCKPYLVSTISLLFQIYSMRTLSRHLRYFSSSVEKQLILVALFKLKIANCSMCHRYTVLEIFCQPCFIIWESKVWWQKATSFVSRDKYSAQCIYIIFCHALLVCQRDIEDTYLSWFLDKICIMTHVDAHGFSMWELGQSQKITIYERRLSFYSRLGYAYIANWGPTSFCFILNHLLLRLVWSEYP